MDEYAYSNKLLKTRQKHCRDCMAKFNKAYYKRHGEKHRETVRQSRITRKVAAREYINEYLSTHPCIDCGESDLVVLQFHHVSGKKRDAVANLARGNHSLDRIKREVNKCVVLCANCHQRRTAKEQGWY